MTEEQTGIQKEGDIIKLLRYISKERHKQHGDYMINPDLDEYTLGLGLKLKRAGRDVVKLLNGDRDSVNPDTLLDTVNYLIIVLAKTDIYKKHEYWKRVEEANK